MSFCSNQPPLRFFPITPSPPPPPPRGIPSSLPSSPPLPHFLSPGCYLHPTPVSSLPLSTTFPRGLFLLSSHFPAPSFHLTLLSDLSSSDGHTDSAFGESIVSTSSVSTPVAGRSSNRFNPVAITTMNQEGEAVTDLVSQQSSSSNLLESAAVHLQEAREDEEAGYARLEDIRSAKKTQKRYSHSI